jgi:tetratricopeptide (TPR) repeat protein
VQLRGFAAWLSGDFDRAEPRLRSCLRRFGQLGDAESSAAALVHLGAVALYRGDLDRAAALLDTGLERYAALGFSEGVAWAHDLRGRVDLRGRRLDRAGVHLDRSLALHRTLGDRWRTASVVEALAELARLRDAPRRAAALLAHAAHLRAAIGAPVPACERAEVAATEAAVRVALGDAAYDGSAAAGRTVDLDALLADGDLPAGADAAVATPG